MPLPLLPTLLQLLLLLACCTVSAVLPRPLLPWPWACRRLEEAEEAMKAQRQQHERANPRLARAVARDEGAGGGHWWGWHACWVGCCTSSVDARH